MRRFHGAYFWGLDETHFWGANLGPKIWSVIRDNNQKLLDINNPLFLRTKYSELISQTMQDYQRNVHPCSIDGAFQGNGLRLIYY